MTWKRLLLNFLGLAALLVLIGVFGPMSSRCVAAKYKREIDKNGVPGMAKITWKKSKMKIVVFRYEYNRKMYKNSESNEYCYEEFRIGDSINIKLDAGNPGDSYITETK